MTSDGEPSGGEQCMHQQNKKVHLAANSRVEAKIDGQLGQSLFYLLSLQLRSLRFKTHPSPVMAVFMAEGQVSLSLFPSQFPFQCLYCGFHSSSAQWWRRSTGPCHTQCLVCSPCTLHSSQTAADCRLPRRDP